MFTNYKYKYYYDSQNYLIAQSSFSKFLINSQLELTDSSIYINDNNGNNLSIEKLLFDSTFSKSEFTINSFDNLNRIENILLKEWDSSLQSYSNFYEIVYTYSGNLSIYETSQTNLLRNNQNRPFEKITNAFLGNKLDFSLKEEFGNAGSWSPRSKNYYKYSITGFNNINDNVINSKLFPNPSNGVFTYQISVDKPENTNLSISDISGRLVYQLENLQLNQGENTISINQQLPKGIYSVKLTTSTSIDIQKLIIN